MHALLVTTLLAACGPRDPCERAAAYEPVVELGIGEDAFLPVQDGDTLQAEFGPQGGHHVWISLRSTGLEPGTWPQLLQGDPGPVLFLEYVGLDDTETLGELDTYERPFRGDAESAELLGERLMVWNWPEEEDAWGRTVSEGTLYLTAEDSCGTQVEDEWDLSVER
ncbi:MAG: hypothetical protein GY913_19340 [Proteobacteria bacterium]|nr:hypothetical protein [Pseudomonadota bacterium]MCP4919065.1 hypothetical protein [Pseudomonadota bacterium]